MSKRHLGALLAKTMMERGGGGGGGRERERERERGRRERVGERKRFME